MLKPLHQGISVPDMDASVAWYSRVFGFKTVSDEYVDFLSCRIVFMQLGDFQLELFQYTGADKRPLPPERLDPNEDLKTCGTKHVAYAVNDLPGLAVRLKAEGVDFAKEVFQMNDDLVCFIRDNSGTLIELIEKSARLH